MTPETYHYARGIRTLELTLEYLDKSEPESIEFEIFRNAAVKGFELTLETAGKLLRKALKAYTGRPRDVDALTYKDVLRQATKHTLFYRPMMLCAGLSIRLFRFVVLIS